MNDNLWTAAIIAAGILIVRLTLTGFRHRGDQQVDIAASTPPLQPSPGRRPLGITILAGVYFASSAWTVLVLLLDRAVPVFFAAFCTRHSALKQSRVACWRDRWR